MSLTREQQIALQLAGAVGLPSPFPATATVRAVAGGRFAERLSKAYRGQATLSARLLAKIYANVHLKVVQSISPRLKITRLIPLGEVRAAFVPSDYDCVSLDSGRWYLPGDLALAATEAFVDRYDRLGRETGVVEAEIFPRPAIVYLAEASPLILQVEVSMTAAESVEYYPPLPHDRSLDFRAFCTNLDKWKPPISS